MTGRRVGIRGGGSLRPRPLRSGRPIRRASARLTPVRAAALLAMLLSAAATYGVCASSAFALREVEVPDLRYTDPAAVRSNLLVADGANLFLVSTKELSGRVARLPAVASARVEVALPDRLVVQIEERDPILVWQVADRRYLVDRRGVLFATAPPIPLPGADTLPVVVDRRVSSVAALGTGDLLEPAVLDAATRLASLAPSDVGSAAESLSVELGDESGFELHAGVDGWVAIFGFYTPTLRAPDLIPGQVRLLRSLLADREATVERVVLADETNGTYLPRPTPRPSAARKP